ncbi:hypothetical protein EZS27_016548 [termite gut metagenome]|uniref:Uncharacterized protein n=1 Tax=termite gut metagenome TaxID=433724 RepID=A0A5J4RMV7_9ZZZZ
MEINRRKLHIYSDYTYFSMLLGGLTGITVEHLISALLFLENLKIK